MRRCLVLAVAVLLAFAAPTSALAGPRLSNAQKRAISTVVNRWVNDMVRRQNLADGWKIAGPPMRGGLTRKAWVSGREVPVQQFTVVNNPRTAWYATWKTRSEIGLVFSIKTGHGLTGEMINEEMVLAKQRGSWVVNSFYPDGIFRLGAGHSGSCVSSKCKVTGLADYGPGGAGAGFASGKAPIPVLWAGVIVVAVAALVVLALLYAFLRRRRRYRRARAAYLGSR